MGLLYIFSCTSNLNVLLLYIQVQAPLDTEEWTPYVTTRLPWTPLTPAFGLEEFGLPTPRRNAETWRHFDVAGMVEQDYSLLPEGIGMFPMKGMHCFTNI